MGWRTKQICDILGNKIRSAAFLGDEVTKDMENTKFLCDEIDAKRLMEVDLIQFLDDNGHSDSVMRWQVDMSLNAGMSTQDMRDRLDMYKRGERAIYSKMVDGANVTFGRDRDD